MVPGLGLDVFPFLNCRADVVSYCVVEVGDGLALVIEKFLVEIICGRAGVSFCFFKLGVHGDAEVGAGVEYGIAHVFKYPLHGGCGVFGVGVDGIFQDYLVFYVVSGDAADVSEILHSLAEHLRSSFGAHVEAWLGGVGR